MVKKKFFKPWLIAGMVTLCMLIGISGCGTTDTASSSTQQKTESTDSTQKQNQNNPAVKASMNIITLQQNTDVALTSDQKTTLKPILTELVSSTDTSQNYLQKKADAITAVFTDAQKTFLTKAQKAPGENKADGNSGKDSDKKQSSTPPSGNPPANASKNDQANKSDINNQSGTNQGEKQNGQQAPQAKDIYQKALNSLS